MRTTLFGRSVAAAVLMTGAAAVQADAATPTGAVTRVSVASDGSQGNGLAVDPSTSADGRYVAFSSHASNLVPGDANGVRDVFVHDRLAATTSRVSVSSTGQEGSAQSNDPVITPDGRYVAFSSSASNLVPGDSNGAISDIFVHDRVTGETTMVGRSSDGTQGDANSFDPSISADASVVAFTSLATNLVGLDLNGVRDVFAHDRQSGQTTLLSVSSGAPPTGGMAGDAASLLPAISADGNVVAFQSDATTLLGVRGDTNARTDIYVRDRTTSTTTRVSVDSAGGADNNVALNPTISGDGTLVAFDATSSDLVVGDTNGVADVFIHDRTTATTTRVSLDPAGGEGNGLSIFPVLSADGTHVAFGSGATNLVAGDTNNRQDVFLRDLTTGVTTRVNVANDGLQDDGGFQAPIAVDNDGRHVAFVSLGKTLVPGDTNGASDIFVHAAASQLPRLGVGDATVHEGDAGSRGAVFTVTLSKPSATTVTVAYATANTSADASDFTAKSGTLSFAPGVTTATVKVPVAGDTTDEADEAFSLQLSAPTKAVIADGGGVGTILDDDPATITGRRLAIGDVSIHEGNEGARTAMFNVSLSKASTGYVTVSFATAKASATGTDFTAKSGRLTFAPGATTLNVKVAITPDTLTEGDESFSVNLSAASGATIADGVGIGTVIDDD